MSRSPSSPARRSAAARYVHMHARIVMPVIADGRGDSNVEDVTEHVILGLKPLLSERAIQKKIGEVRVTRTAKNTFAVDWLLETRLTNAALTTELQRALHSYIGKASSVVVSVKTATKRSTTSPNTRR